MKFNLRKEDINSKVDEVLSIDPSDLDLKDLSPDCYVDLVCLSDEILSGYDIEYECDVEGLDEIDYVSFISKSSRILLKMPKSSDLNCSFDLVDYGIIIDSKISFAQRNNLSETFKTSSYCCNSPIDMIIVNLICDEIFKKRKWV